MGAVCPPITPMKTLKEILREQRPKRLHSLRWYCLRRGQSGRSLRRSY